MDLEDNDAERRTFEVSEDFRDHIKDQLEVDYRLESRRIFIDLICCTTFELVCKTRAQIMGHRPGTDRFDEAVESMKEVFLSRWKDEVVKSHKAQPETKVRLQTGHEVTTDEMGIDLDDMFEGLIEDLETQVRAMLSMTPRADDILNMFPDLRGMEGPPL